MKRICVLILCGLSCATPVRIADPKLIASEKFIAACAANEMSTIVPMLRNGANVNSQNLDFQATCLHYAAYKGNATLVELLLKSGASVEIQDREGQTPLFDAVFVARNKPADYDSRVISLLLAHGAAKTINLTPKESSPLLYWACRFHEPSIIKLLLDYGADPKVGEPSDWPVRCIESRLESGSEKKRQQASEIRQLLEARGAKFPK